MSTSIADAAPHGGIPHEDRCTALQLLLSHLVADGDKRAKASDRTASRELSQTDPDRQNDRHEELTTVRPFEDQYQLLPVGVAQ